MKIRPAFIIAAAIILVIVLLYRARGGKKCDCGCGCEEGRCDCPKCTCEKCHKKWKVYGAEWCGWTRKQLDYMKNNGKAYEFINCENGQCNGIKSFPTLVSSDGEKFTGYREV